MHHARKRSWHVMALAVLVAALLSCGGITLPGAGVAGPLFAECKETLKDSLLSQKTGTLAGTLLVFLLFLQAVVLRVAQKEPQWRWFASRVPRSDFGAAPSPPWEGRHPALWRDPLLRAFLRGVVHGKIYRQI